MKLVVISHLYTQKYGRLAFIVTDEQPTTSLDKATKFEKLSDARAAVTSRADKICTLEKAQSYVSDDPLYGYAHGALNSRDLRGH